MYVYLLTILCVVGIAIGQILFKVSANSMNKTPFMALAFVIVPLASRFFFGERFAPTYFIGTALIMSGIVVTVAASR